MRVWRPRSCTKPQASEEVNHLTMGVAANRTGTAITEKPGTGGGLWDSFVSAVVPDSTITSLLATSKFQGTVQICLELFTTSEHNQASQFALALLRPDDTGLVKVKEGTSISGAASMSTLLALVAAVCSDRTIQVEMKNCGLGGAALAVLARNAPSLSALTGLDLSDNGAIIGTDICQIVASLIDLQLLDRTHACANFMVFRYHVPAS